MATDLVTMDKIVSLCKRRGFIFPSSEIHGGIGSTYDYGHYGALLKTNVKNEWWRSMLQERDDIVALDSDRKSTRLNSSHANISYAVFCLKIKITSSARTPP